MLPRAVITPAEHQALLNRRAWVEHYAAQRRALAEWRAHQRYEEYEEVDAED